jgi:hypothetical protein
MSEIFEVSEGGSVLVSHATAGSATNRLSPISAIAKSRMKTKPPRAHLEDAEPDVLGTQRFVIPKAITKWQVPSSPWVGVPVYWSALSGFSSAGLW